MPSSHLDEQKIAFDCKQINCDGKTRISSRLLMSLICHRECYAFICNTFIPFFCKCDKHHHKMMAKTDMDYTFWQQRDQFSQTSSGKLTSNQRSLFIDLQRFWQVTSISCTHSLSVKKHCGVFFLQDHFCCKVTSWSFNAKILMMINIFLWTKTFICDSMLWEKSGINHSGVHVSKNLVSICGPRKCLSKTWYIKNTVAFVIFLCFGRTHKHGWFGPLYGSTVLFNSLSEGHGTKADLSAEISEAQKLHHIRYKKIRTRSLQ